MIANYNSENKTYTFIRQDWKEFFRIFVSGSLLDNMVEGAKLPRGFIKTHEPFAVDHSVFWKWYLYPFVKICLFIKDRWFKVGRWFYLKGYLGARREEGITYHWFWLRYLRFKK